MDLNPTFGEFTRSKGTRRERVDDCLRRVMDPSGEGARTYLTVWADQARIVADRLDTMAEAGERTPLDGMPISVKDLFDVEGEVTRAAAVPLNDAAPAARDAPVVERLRRTGAVLIGRTNMTPFAYSVVGLNEHFGTPCNPADRTRTPGGSSSGAAVSVAAGMATAAVGSDTVGSIRVPAALCGVVGLKPTQSRVPLAGANPLSPTLDSIGPLATTVADCARVFAAMAGEEFRPPRPRPIGGLRVALPNAHFFEGLDPIVAAAFLRARRKLSVLGVNIVGRNFEALNALSDNSLMRSIQSTEAFTWHESLLARREGDYEPRIRDRILAGRAILASEYIRALSARTQLIASFEREASGFDAAILPTVPIVAPTFAECEADEDGIRARLMRNTAPFNVLDACALTVPIHEHGELPVGLMIVAPRGCDDRLLCVGCALEAAFEH